LGSAVSFPIVVWGEVPTEIEFGALNMTNMTKLA